MQITVEDGSQLSEEAVQALGDHADMIECKCPVKLIEILEKVRAFSEYTDQCIEKYPDDRDTHKWLKANATNLDQLISTTLVQLARFEGFINEDNEIVDRSES